MSEAILSPKGSIQFCALTRKVKKKPQDTENTVYTVRLEFNGSAKGVASFRKRIEAVNKAIIGTKHASKPGNFTVQASTKFTVNVGDEEGRRLKLEEIPSYIKSGTAAIVVMPYTGNKLGGSLNLQDVILYDYEEGEFSNEGEEVVAERLKAAVAKLKGI